MSDGHRTPNHPPDGPEQSRNVRPNHMTPEEFRTRGYQVIDWLASYFERIEDLPVRAQVEPGEVRAHLPEHPPDEPEPFDQILADVERVILPGLTHWQSPNFYAYFPGNSSGPSVLGDLLSSGFAVQGMLWATSPACTELETHMADWMIELCDLPPRFRSDGPGGGVIQDSASSSTLCALLAARQRAGGVDRIGELVAYASADAHSSVAKAARIAGLADEQLRLVPVGAERAMAADQLAAMVSADVDAGRRPFFATATTGTTSTTALDPVADIAEIASRQSLWLHVDGAFAGSAAVCPELRFVNAGLDRADSYTFNPHKWLLTNFDCSLLYVSDRGPLLDALAILPDYLRNPASESGAVIDYRDWQVPLGRRFRALKLWFVLRHYGASGLRAHIRDHVAAAQAFAGWVDGHPDFELAAPAPLSLVCFRHTGGDEVNRAIVERANASGHLYMTHTVLDGRYTLRLAVGSARTELSHVEAAWERIVATAEEIRATETEGRATGDGASQPA